MEGRLSAKMQQGFVKKATPMKNQDAVISRHVRKDVEPRIFIYLLLAITFLGIAGFWFVASLPASIFDIPTIPAYIVGVELVTLPVWIKLLQAVRASSTPEAWTFRKRTFPIVVVALLSTLALNSYAISPGNADLGTLSLLLLLASGFLAAALGIWGSARYGAVACRWWTQRATPPTPSCSASTTRARLGTRRKSCLLAPV